MNTALPGQAKILNGGFRLYGATTPMTTTLRLETSMLALGQVAQAMAGHESSRTTGLYDRRNDAVALDEVEQVVF